MINVISPSKLHLANMISNSYFKTDSYISTWLKVNHDFRSQWSSGNVPYCGPSWLVWSGVGGHLALSLHSSNAPGELSQWLAMMTAL